jgi:NAD(P)-dependent dehydrogenase (short-subunit alcohol dehydrogenase family)
MGIWFSSNNMKAENPKVILITGASSGLGKVSALHLLGRGHIVYGAARRVEQMQDLVAKGGHAIKLDVTDEQSCVDAVKRIIGEQGKIDVLVNNAGFALYGPVELVPVADAQRQFQVNLFGLAQLTKQVVPHMRSAGAGTIINVSSMGGLVYTPFGAWYHATKYALEGWSDCLRLELAPFGIKVAIVEPGGFKTELGHGVFDKSIEMAKDTPYLSRLEKLNAAAENSQNMLGDPIVIAKVIQEAVEAKNPKHRYLKGPFAREFVFIKSWFGTAVFDWVLNQQF